MYKYFASAAFLFGINICHAQNFGFKPYQEYASQKAIATEASRPASLNWVKIPEWNQTISLNESGDGVVSIPVVTVSGRRLKLPLTINYLTSGIKVDQVASEVGLGWNISFGSITRNFGAFEPDYTTTTSEFDMVNVYKNGTYPPDGVLVADEPNNYFTVVDPLSFHKKQLKYTGIQSGKAPDNYSVRIPGEEENDFWNSASIGNASPSFIFSKKSPARIEYETKTFIFGQEVSRINEWTYRENLGGLLSGFSGANTWEGYNMAAAIGFLPYVKNNKANTLVANVSGDADPSPIPTVHPLDFCPNYVPGPGNESARIEYEDYSKFIITDENGTKFIFGRPVRGQKYLFTEEPFWSAYSIMTPRSTDKCYGEFWKTDYIAEWLLTEIQANDYEDVNQNGIADDADEGDWIKIEYTSEFAVDNIPGLGIFPFKATHRDWQNFTQTDNASSLFRERAYVTKITTPIEEIDFSSSERFDINHDYFKEVFNRKAGSYPYYTYENVNMTGVTGNVCGAEGGLPFPTLDNKVYVRYPVEVKKYDLITVKDKSANPLRTVRFDYAVKGSQDELAVANYLMLKNDKTHVNTNPGQPIDINDYQQSVGRGKTTLKGITYGGAQITASSISYQFKYGYNPSYNDIHKYHILKQWGMPTVRESWDGISQRRFSGLYPSAGANKPIFNSLLPWKWLQTSYWNGVSSGSNEVTGADNNSNIVQFSNPLQTDEMGYFNDPSHAVTLGRDAWALSAIVLPYGGEIEIEYGRDNFDISTDRQAWRSSGIADYCIPMVGNYNNIAHLRSLKQDYINSVETPSPSTGSDPKHLYREYYYLMNQYTGGLRIEKIKYIEPITSTTVTKIYRYGTGHYTTPPADYWQNYLEGFNAFMQAEAGRHFHGEAYFNNSMQAGPNINCGNYIYNDFTIFMSRLITNTRVDNSVGIQSRHYYEYIDEVNPQGAYTRRHYGRLYRNQGSFSPVVYHSLKDAAIKQEFLDRTDVVELLTSDLDYSKEIGLYKTQLYNGNNVMVREEESEFEFSQLAQNVISSKRLDLTAVGYSPFLLDKSSSANTAAKFLRPQNASSHALYAGVDNTTLATAEYDYGAPFSGHIDLVGLAKNPLFLLEYSSSYHTSIAPQWFQPLVQPNMPNSAQILLAMTSLKLVSDNSYKDVTNAPFTTDEYYHYVDLDHKIKPITFRSHQSYILRPTKRSVKNYFQ